MSFAVGLPDQDAAAGRLMQNQGAILHLADTLTTGIVKQFPERFN